MDTSLQIISSFVMISNITPIITTSRAIYISEYFPVGALGSHTYPKKWKKPEKCTKLWDFLNFVM